MLNFDMIGSPNFYRGMERRGALHVFSRLHFTYLFSSATPIPTGVYEGDSANRPPNTFGPKVATGSTSIQLLFEEYFNSTNMAFSYSSFDGRSDYGPFIRHQIPAGSSPGVWDQKRLLFPAAPPSIPITRLHDMAVVFVLLLDCALCALFLTLWTTLFLPPPPPKGGLFTGAEQIKTPEERILYGGLANAAYDPCYHQSCDDINNVDTKVMTEMGGAAGYVLYALTTAADLQSVLFPNATAAL